MKLGIRSKSILFLCSLCLCVSAVNLSCGSKPTDMRALVPSDTLVYLETNDLGAALQPIVDSKPFNEVAKSKPDLSAIKGVQLAVAITGFETSEEKLTDENSVGRIQPHFVAIADTHAWNWQAVRFAEQKLGAFVAEVYDSEPTLEKSDKNGGKYFVWTAKDGRKAYALVIDSLIYFGNDESAIDKCLAVRRGEADNISKTGKVPAADPATLASGYVSTDGIAQIANIIGLKFASDASEDSEVQRAVADILPQLLRNSVTEIKWTSSRGEYGIEDKYLVTMPPEVANVFNETLAPGDNNQITQEVDTTLIAELPPNAASVTRYNLKNPQIAWRSILLVAQKQSDTVAGKMIAEFAAALFEPYGIRDPELFTSAVGGEHDMGRNILTAKLDPDGEEPVVIATRGNDLQILKSLELELKPPKTVIEGGTNLWSTPDGDLQLVFDGNGAGIGSKKNLAACLFWTQHNPYELNYEPFRQLALSTAPITTVTQDGESAAQIVDMLAEKKSDNAKIIRNAITETRFTKNGIERRTVSDFGFIGWIIAQLANE
jgi:hypothetical protein